ncbi:hypothetical protein UlMin_031720 [Ulmus minor]
MAHMHQDQESQAYGGGDDDTHGMVDIKGRPALRSKTGGWKACSFIVVYEVFERLAFVGIQANLVLYLTRELHQGTVKSSSNVSNWIGTLWLTPVLGAYVADSYLGRYWTFIISSAIYLMGMILLTLAVSIPSLKPPPCNPGIKEEDCAEASPHQIGIFYLALYIIALANGGTKPNISTLGADQFDDLDPKEKTHKLSFFNWWMASVFSGALFSSTVLVYIQDNLGWTLGYGLPTAGILLSLLIFVAGTPFYRHKKTSGSGSSPFIKMAKVLVAAVRKGPVPLPNDPKELHELTFEEYAKIGIKRIDHTPSLRFLDRAAVKIGSNSPWMLCPVTQVEETKQMIKMLPVLLVMFIPSTAIAQVVTLFVKQGTTLDRSMGPNFDIPPASLIVFVTIFMLLTIFIYDRFLMPTVRRYSHNPRGITLLQRLGIGLVLLTTAIIAASLSERRRLSVARKYQILGKNQTVPLTVFTLLPQFAIVGIADAFLEVGKLEFFYDQAPESMKSIGSSFYCISIGAGFFLNSILLTTVSDITKRNGHKGWILDNLNESHLDYYYAFLAVLCFLNFLFFLVVARFFVYNAEANKSDIDLASQEITSAT